MTLYNKDANNTIVRSTSSHAIVMAQDEAHPRLQELPSEMLSFTLNAAFARASAPRLGRLVAKGRKEILTPGYLAPTSRGAIVHITPDVQAKHTNVSGCYMALEDCKSTKHEYVALPLN